MFREKGCPYRSAGLVVLGVNCACRFKTRAGLERVPDSVTVIMIHRSNAISTASGGACVRPSERGTIRRSNAVVIDVYAVSDSTISGLLGWIACIARAGEWGCMA